MRHDIAGLYEVAAPVSEKRVSRLLRVLSSHGLSARIQISHDLGLAYCQRHDPTTEWGCQFVQQADSSRGSPSFAAQHSSSPCGASGLGSTCTCQSGLLGQRPRLQSRVPQQFWLQTSINFSLSVCELLFQTPLLFYVIIPFTCFHPILNSCPLGC